MVQRLSTMRACTACCVLLASLLVVATGATDPSKPAIQVRFGDNLGTAIPKTVETLLGQVATVGDRGPTLVFGDHTLCQSVISPQALQKVGSEGFLISSAGPDGLICADGNRNRDPVYGRAGITVSAGAIYGSLSLLDHLGFAMISPFRGAILPAAPVFADNLKRMLMSREVVAEQSPSFNYRAWHTHTEHPLELIEVLNGFDAVLDTGATVAWEDMLPQYENMLLWLVWNRQNRFEWVIMYSASWPDVWSQQRKERLQELQSRAHDMSILIGHDRPISMTQQHAAPLVWLNDSLTKPAMEAQIRKSIDWTCECSDFITSELGQSEFTHADDLLNLHLMNYAAQYVHTSPSCTTGHDMHIKAHISTGQFCQHLTNPCSNTESAGGPLNFNWLPMMADQSMAIDFHTVQVYDYQSDPVPNVYGNSNFTYQWEWVECLARNTSSTRDLVFFGETSYYINMDTEIGVFIPLYAQRRIADFQLIAKSAAQWQTTDRLIGMVNFESGFEMSYGLVNTLVARAMWNPYPDLSPDQAFDMLLSGVLRFVGDEDLSVSVQSLLFDTNQAQSRLLVYGGRSGNVTGLDLEFRNGMAYLSGWDTWAALPLMLNISATQPSRYALQPWPGLHMTADQYASIRDLLERMDLEFSDLSLRAQQLVSQSSKLHPSGLAFMQELADSFQLLSVRAAFVDSVYAAANPAAAPGVKKQELQNARALITGNLTAVLKRMTAALPISPHRVAGWRPNPTVYHFGVYHLALSGYYFWRDYYLVAGYPLAYSPCFLNFEDPAEVMMGNAGVQKVAEVLREVGKLMGWEAITDCLARPVDPFVFPLPEDTYGYK